MSDAKDTLKTLRAEIDLVDGEILKLFASRTELVDKIAETKKTANLGILDQSREDAVINRVRERAGEDLSADAAILFSTLIALSRRRQRSLLESAELLPEPKIETARNAGYQGVPGAWQEQAAMKLYEGYELKNYPVFEDVFAAVSSGELDRGVIPIENSTTGAIGEVYDLLRRFGLFIVAQTTVEIKQCLLAKHGTRLSEIREVLSHPEGFKQCHRFLMNKNWTHVTKNNTALAAKEAADRLDGSAAAIGSRRAAELYGLNVLEPDIMDADGNATRFIAVARDPWYTDKSNCISVTFSTAHRAGALCQIMQCFMTASINMSRIESRPATGGKYRFFVDLQGNIMDNAVKDALRQAAGLSEYFEVLGCYNA